MNKIYKEFYKNKVFTISEANKIIKDYDTCKNTISRLISSKQIKRIKSGLYYIVPIDNSNFEPDPIHIAAKLKDNIIVSHNSVLTINKLLPKEKTVYASYKLHSKIRINKEYFKIFKSKQNIGIIDYEYNTGYATITIKATDIERTILDIVWNKTIKISELINTLKQSKTQNISININRIIQYLEKYNNPVLFHKVGYVLDSIKEYQNFQETDLELIRKKLSKKKFYIKEKGLRLIRPKYQYNNKWKLMIPQ